jgi:hypothetical protein
MAAVCSRLAAGITVNGPPNFDNIGNFSPLPVPGAFSSSGVAAPRTHLVVKLRSCAPQSSTWD